MCFQEGVKRHEERERERERCIYINAHISVHNCTQVTDIILLSSLRERERNSRIKKEKRVRNCSGACGIVFLVIETLEKELLLRFTST